jgi:hypothetical protein
LDGGKLGEVVDPLDPDAIAEGFSRLGRLSNAEADRRRAEALVAARQRFSHEATAARMSALLARHGMRF